MANLLTIKEVAAKLHVSARTIQRWQDEGKITFIKIEKVVRFREEVIESWLDKKTIKAQKKIA